MSILYNEYLSGSEREAAIIITESNAEFAKLHALFDIVSANREANMLAAEAKVFAESGTYDDLELLYTEAEKEAEEKQGGILKTIFDAIRRLFAKIKNFFLGKKDDDIPDSMEVDAETDAKVRAKVERASAVQAACAKFQSGDYAGAAAEFGKIIAPITVTAAAAGGVVVWKAATIRDWFAKQKKARETLEGAINNAQSKVDNMNEGLIKAGLDKALEVAQKVVTFIFDNESSMWAKIENFKKGIKSSSAPNNSENDSGNNNTGTDENNNTNANASGNQAKPELSGDDLENYISDAVWNAESKLTEFTKSNEWPSTQKKPKLKTAWVESVQALIKKNIMSSKDKQKNILDNVVDQTITAEINKKKKESNTSTNTDTTTDVGVQIPKKAQAAIKNAVNERFKTDEEYKKKYNGDVNAAVTFEIDVLSKRLSNQNITGKDAETVIDRYIKLIKSKKKPKDEVENILKGADAQTPSADDKQDKSKDDKNATTTSNTNKDTQSTKRELDEATKKEFLTIAKKKISIKRVRDKYPGKTDDEIAKALSEDWISQLTTDINNAKSEADVKLKIEDKLKVCRSLSGEQATKTSARESYTIPPEKETKLRDLLTKISKDGNIDGTMDAIRKKAEGADDADKFVDEFINKLEGNTSKNKPEESTTGNNKSKATQTTNTLQNNTGDTGSAPKETQEEHDFALKLSQTHLTEDEEKMVLKSYASKHKLNSLKLLNKKKRQELIDFARQQKAQNLDLTSIYKESADLYDIDSDDYEETFFESELVDANIEDLSDVFVDL